MRLVEGVCIVIIRRNDDPLSSSPTRFVRQSSGDNSLIPAACSCMIGGFVLVLCGVGGLDDSPAASSRKAEDVTLKGKAVTLGTALRAGEGGDPC